MRLIKMTRLVDCYRRGCTKLLAAAHVHPLPTGKGRAGEPCPCLENQRHRAGALPRGLCCPDVGQGRTTVTSARETAQTEACCLGHVRQEPGQSPVTGTDKYNRPPWQWPPSRMFTNSSVLFHVKKLVFPDALYRVVFNVYS